MAAQQEETKTDGAKRPAQPEEDEFPHVTYAAKFVEGASAKVTELKEKRIDLNGRMERSIKIIGLARDALRAVDAKRFDLAADILEMELNQRRLWEYDKSLDREINDRMGLIKESIRETTEHTTKMRKRRRV
jgi:hypothetical protein